ncbi:MAG: hypothetical protein CVU11_04515 [Bacteroidetes bacterium HGW-Bacteroidetes-6]|nr:MAG: hypothetical protein CVU11_04515 [Bacteroidetes bacterium HGW-Bacteroidetes-6]
MFRNATLFDLKRISANPVFCDPALWIFPGHHNNIHPNPETLTMKRITTFIVVALYLALASSVFAQKDSIRWTPGRCIQYAINHSSNINIIESVLRTDSLMVLQAKAERFPNISAGSDYNYSWVSSTSNSTSSNTENISASVSANLTLFNGHQISLNIRRNLLQMASDSMNLEYNYLILAENIVTYYLQSLYSLEELKINEEQLQLATEQTKIAETKLELQDIIRTDYLQIAADEANNNLQLVQAQNQFNSSRLNLNKLMQLSTDSVVLLIPPEEWHTQTNQSVNSFDSIWQLALNSRPELKMAQINIGIKEQDLAISKANRLPNLSARVSSGWNQDLLSTTATGRINASAGLSLTIPIFNNKQTSTNIALSKIYLENEKTSYESSVYNLKISIVELIQDIVASQAELESASVQLNLAIESYNAALESFSIGKLQTIELLMQKTQLNTARHNVLKAKYNLILSEIILQLYTNSWTFIN